MGCRRWGRTELATTEVTQQQQQSLIKDTPLYLVIMCLYAPMVLRVTNVFFKVIETIQNIYQCHYDDHKQVVSRCLEF